jgi:hypothetical protein
MSEVWDMGPGYGEGMDFDAWLVISPERLAL